MTEVKDRIVDLNVEEIQVKDEAEIEEKPERKMEKRIRNFSIWLPRAFWPI